MTDTIEFDPDLQNTIFTEIAWCLQDGLKKQTEFTMSEVQTYDEVMEGIITDILYLMWLRLHTDLMKDI